MEEALFKDLIGILSQLKPDVDPQRRSDWLRETIGVETHNADQQNDFDSIEARQEKIKELVKKSIARLTAFGGTDMGIIYMDSLGEFSPFETDDGLPQNTNTVIESKQCVVPPVKVNGDMERGNILEPVARRKFKEIMKSEGFKVRLDLMQIFSALYESRLEKYPWLVGAPDDIFEDKNGKIYVVDYKVPANPSLIPIMADHPPTAYNGQMGCYEAILNLHEISVEDRILAPLSLKDMTVTPIYMPRDASLVDTLLQLGDNAWKHVVNGTMPIESRRGGETNIHKELDEATNKYMHEYVFYTSLKNLATRRAESARERLDYLMNQNGMSPKKNEKSKLPLISFSRSITKKKNNKLIEKKLQEMGVDTNDEDFKVTTESIRATVVRGKNDPNINTVNEISSIASEFIDEGLEEIQVRCINTAAQS